MTNSGNFIQITPFIHVDYLEGAISFFRDLLGFEVGYRDGNYAYVHRETAGVRLLGGESFAVPGNRRFAYYIDVRDVDALHAELKPKLDALAPESVHGPVDQPYGQRELMILAPDGNLLVFGQQTAKSESRSNPLKMSQRDLSGSRFTNVRLSNAAFTNVDLSGSSLENVRGHSMAFSNADLRETTFQDTDLTSAGISNSRLTGMRIEGILVTDLIAAYRKLHAS